MRIAQVAPLHESVPPKLYGGTERIVSYLTEELVKQGHDVTLFASGDSVTKADLVGVVPEALRLKHVHDPLAAHMAMLGKVNRRSSEFDIIHYHVDYLHFTQSRLQQIPHVTTLHGRLDLPDLQMVYDEFNDIPVVSISNSQRLPLRQACWKATVYNGVPETNYTFHKYSGNYLAFLGRISPEKRVDRAIEIAIRSGMELKIAAKVDKVDQEYFESEIKPLLRHPRIEYLGEIDEAEKNAFLGNAYALLFPIDWPEPFGLVMIESMACGTPVVAFRRGSVPEVMHHGETGFIVDDIQGALKAVEDVQTISRDCCRYMFESRFSARIMANNYVNVYESMIDREFVPRLAG